MDNIENKFTGKEISATELLINCRDEVIYLIDKIIPKVGQGCLAGGSDIGKSSLLRQLAISVCSSGKDFLDSFKITPTHQSVLYVCTEDDSTAISHLLKKQIGTISPEQIMNLRFLFEYENLLNEIDIALTKNPVDLIIIDCFADAFGGDLKDTQSIRTFLNSYHKLVQKHSCYILWLHHTSKRTEQFEPSKNNLLAGQGFEAKMRLVVELRADLMNPALRHFCIVKGNYLPSDMKKESFVLGFDESNLIFFNTNERVPYELLAKSLESDNGKAKYEIAKTLKNAGKTYEEIAVELGFASKGSVSKLFTKAKEKGWE